MLPCWYVPVRSVWLGQRIPVLPSISPCAILLDGAVLTCSQLGSGSSQGFDSVVVLFLEARKNQPKSSAFQLTTLVCSLSCRAQ